MKRPGVCMHVIKRRKLVGGQGRCRICVVRWMDGLSF